MAGFAFAHVLINPIAGYIADSAMTPVLTIVGLLLFVGIASVAFWAYFRFRRRRATGST